MGNYIFEKEKISKRYLTNWEYNLAKIFTKLTEIIEEKGGTVTAYKPHNVVNCDAAAIVESKYRMSRLTPDVQSLAKDQAENEIFVTQSTYIGFVLGGVYYTYSANDNPLFPFGYTKSKIKEGGKCEVVLLEEDQYQDAKPDEPYKVWFTDSLWTQISNDDVIEIAANKMLEFLINAPVGKPVVNKTRVRVSNTYDAGYHYEMKTSPIKYIYPLKSITCYYF